MRILFYVIVNDNISYCKDWVYPVLEIKSFWINRDLMSMRAEYLNDQMEFLIPDKDGVFQWVSAKDCKFVKKFWEDTETDQTPNNFKDLLLGMMNSIQRLNTNQAILQISMDTSDIKLTENIIQRFDDEQEPK